MNQKPKSLCALVHIAKKNARRARRHIGIAWQQIQQMQLVLARANRLHPLKPRS